MKQLIRKVGAKVLTKSGTLNLLWKSRGNYRILMYHRTIDPEALKYPIQAGMYVRAKTFEMHCEMLRKHYNVVPLRELISLVSSKTEIPSNTVALTFDDGWRDNLEGALPALKRFDIPATVFLPTAFIGTNKLFWTDLVGYYLKERKQGLRIEQLETIIGSLSNQRDLLEGILKKLFQLDLKGRRDFISMLQFVLAGPNSKLNPPREFISWDEARKTEEGGLVHFANHTHDHELLGELSEEEGVMQVQRAGKILAQELKNSLPDILALPGGSRPAWVPPVNTYLTTTLNVADCDSSIALGRVGIHEDIASNESLFRSRITLGR